jgi:hypothetical protein
MTEPESVPCVVYVTDTETGETRSRPDKWFSFSEFDWAENNRSCNCTRAEYFAKIKGEPDPDLKCGEGRFIVEVCDPEGRIIYSEGDAIEGVASLGFIALRG